MRASGWHTAAQDLTLPCRKPTQNGDTKDFSVVPMPVNLIGGILFTP
jgi:hypothetical protein